MCSASYVSALSLANMSGRLGWATVSDNIGRRNTMLTFGLLGVPACIAVPQWTAMASADPSNVLPLGGFYGSTLLLISMYRFQPRSLPFTSCTLHAWMLGAMRVRSLIHKGLDFHGNDSAVFLVQVWWRLRAPASVRR